MTKSNCHEILRFRLFADVKNPTDSYHQIEFEEDPLEIDLERKQVEEDAAEGQKTYAFPAGQHL